VTTKIISATELASIQVNPNRYTVPR